MTPNRSLQILSLIFAGVAAALAIGAALNGTPFYRDQHLGTALVYAKNGIDLWHPVIVGFNATGTPSIQEFPLWQAFAAVTLRIFGGRWGAASGLSLVFLWSALWPLYQIVNRAVGPRRAWWTLVFFLAQPLIVVMSGLAGTDGLSIAVCIWFFYAADRSFRTTELRFGVLAALFATLAAVQKAPFFFAYGTASALWLATGPSRRNVRAWVTLMVCGVFSGAVFLLWIRHANAEHALAELPLVELRLSKNPEQVYWWFGDLAYRLNPSVWLKAGWRVLNDLCGSIGFIVIPLTGLVVSRSRLALVWLAGATACTLIFTHVVLHHHHYYLMLSAPCALLGAEAIVWLEEKIAMRTRLVEWGRPLLLGAGLCLAILQGLIDMETVLAFDRYPYEIAQKIAEKTSEQDRLLIQGGGWGGQILMITNRRGLSIWNSSFVESATDLQRVKELGYNKIVLISESPLLWACQKTNPGSGNLERDLWRNHVSPAIKDWPAEFESDDLLIKDIP